MKYLAFIFASGILLCSCGGGGKGGSDGGPTAPPPNPIANVQGTWNGTSTGTLVHGPVCIGSPVPTPVKAVINQTGSNITLTITLNSVLTCSFHGTVGATSIGWTFDQQQANPNCLGFRRLPCRNSNGSIRFIDSRQRTGDLNGNVLGNQISVTGDSIADILDSGTGEVIDTLELSGKIQIQKQ
jgi:hypothetical protein